jgi:hypothetical protein
MKLKILYLFFFTVEWAMGLFTAISLSEYTHTSTFNKNNVSHCLYTKFCAGKIIKFFISPLYWHINFWWDV